MGVIIAYRLFVQRVRGQANYGRGSLQHWITIYLSVTVGATAKWSAVLHVAGGYWRISQRPLTLAYLCVLFLRGWLLRRRLWVIFELTQATGKWWMAPQCFFLPIYEIPAHSLPCALFSVCFYHHFHPFLHNVWYNNTEKHTNSIPSLSNLLPDTKFNSCNEPDLSAKSREFLNSIMIKQPERKTNILLLFNYLSLLQSTYIKK